jgi:hypothetical protein
VHFIDKVTASSGEGIKTTEIYVKIKHKWMLRATKLAIIDLMCRELIQTLANASTLRWIETLTEARNTSGIL